MVGGLIYELLTAGTAPFHWLLLGDTSSAVQRLTTGSAAPVDVPGAGLHPGLLNKNVLEAAAIDGVEIPWRVQVDNMTGDQGRLAELKDLMMSCWALDPSSRPRLQSLVQHVADLLERQRAESPKVGPGGLP